MSGLNIRVSRQSELGAIRELHMAAFAGEGHAGYDESEEVTVLALNLLKAGPDVLSLVAVDGEEVIGHIIFSPASITNHGDIRCFILVPLAVSPTRQKSGTGARLIKAGLDRLKRDGVQAVFVLGDPAYYSRSGFHTRHRVAPPYELPYPEAWQVIELEPGILDDVSGTLECLPELMSPELW